MKKWRGKMIKDVENIDKEVSWLTFKGYSIRLEVSKKFTNSNLVITVNPSSEEDYTHKLVVEGKN
jgi:hypothetical protein